MGAGRIGAVVLIATVAAVLLWPDSGKTSKPVADPSPTTALRSSPSASLQPSPTTTGRFLPGGPVPAAASAVTQTLVTGSSAQQRGVLTAGLAAQLPQAAVFPVGSLLAVDGDSWHQDGHYANLTGTLTVPGSTSQRIEIGLTDESGAWLVTFEEPAS